jgi:hypothetical protein
MNAVAYANNESNRFKGNFVDLVTRVTHNYLLVKHSGSCLGAQGLVVASAAKIGLRVADNSAFISLVLNIAEKSQNKTPLIRDKDWRNDLYLRALNEMS